MALAGRRFSTSLVTIEFLPTDKGLICTHRGTFLEGSDGPLMREAGGIVEMLRRKPQSVTRLPEPLGISLTAVAQHQQVSEEAGLVRTQKLGRVRTASVDTAGLGVLAAWVRRRRPVWSGG